MRGLARAAAGTIFLRMYSRTSEPVRFERDCAAVMVPQGEAVDLPAGSIGYITQALGGSYTVFVEGNLFRIAGRDAQHAFWGQGNVVAQSLLHQLALRIAA